MFGNRGLKKTLVCFSIRFFDDVILTADITASNEMILCLFSDASSTAWFVTLNGRMEWYAIDVEGSGHCLFKVISQHLPGRTKENHDKSDREAGIGNRDLQGTKREFCCLKYAVIFGRKRWEDDHERWLCKDLERGCHGIFRDTNLAFAFKDWG
jgi:hypothetical protein